jgi:hypothetical protein
MIFHGFRSDNDLPVAEGDFPAMFHDTWVPIRVGQGEQLPYEQRKWGVFWPTVVEQSVGSHRDAIWLNLKNSLTCK